MGANLLAQMTETSCLVNVMHEILVSRWNQRRPCIAVCPNQRLEKHVGFDVALPDFHKVLALQFKAYRTLKGNVQDYFSIYGEQHSTLLKYPMNCAFYVFSDHRTHKDMDQDRRREFSGQPYLILNNTWFVEVHSTHGKRIYRNQLASGAIPSIRWRDVDVGLIECRFGFSIVRTDGHYVLHDAEQRIVEVLEIPSGRFSLFYTTTARAE